MAELNVEEIEAVGGGLVPALIALAVALLLVQEVY